MDRMNAKQGNITTIQYQNHCVVYKTRRKIWNAHISQAQKARLIKMYKDHKPI